MVFVTSYSWDRLNAELGDKEELGVMLPFIYLTLVFLTLLADFVIQFIISVSGNGWKVLWLTQILIIVIIGVFKMQTVHYPG